eukprot:scaffold22775_cov253-Isochrysis_galbana.AAC.1
MPSRTRAQAECHPKLQAMCWRRPARMGMCAFSFSSDALQSQSETPHARGGVTMAPFQLRLEPAEVVLATDKV